MRTSVRVNIQGLEDRVYRGARAVDDAALEAVVSAADAVVDELERIAPRDTQRYVRGWQMAMRQAGQGVPGAKYRVVDPVRESRFMAQNYERLNRQVKRIEKTIEFRERRLRLWYDNKNRKPDAWYRDQVKRIKQYKKLLERAKVQRRLIDDDEGTAIVIGASKKGRRLITVRTKIYGGMGSHWAREGRAGVKLKNLEAHASIVESNSHPLQKAVASTAPKERAGKAFAERMRTLAGTTMSTRAVAIER